MNVEFTLASGNGNGTVDAADSISSLRYKVALPLRPLLAPLIPAGA